MVLGYSRYKYIEFFTTQNTAAFLKGHNNAFKYFKGYTKEILYDNLKSVVIKRLLKTKDSVFNKKFMDFAGYYGFKPILCRPYKPNTKGKVENAVNYIKKNFLAGEEFKSLRELNSRALEWLNKVNNKIHSTTKEIPANRLKRENLISLESKDLYDLTETIYRKVLTNCHFSYNANLYSVPYKYAGKEISIKLKDSYLHVNYRGQEIAKHKEETNKKGVYITMDSHLKGLKELRYGIFKKREPKIKEITTLTSLYKNINIEEVEQRDLQIYEGVC